MTTDVAAALPLLEARIEKLTQALFHVAGELWAVRDRQAVLERLLADAGIAAPALIDSYRPEAALAATLAAQREAYVAGILAFLAPDA
jgi:hypothetical protein